jgi:hypothetical protein
LWLQKIEEIGKFVSNSVNSRKKCSKKWKFLTKFTNHEIKGKYKNIGSGPWTINFGSAQWLWVGQFF